MRTGRIRPFFRLFALLLTLVTVVAPQTVWAQAAGGGKCDISTIKKGLKKVQQDKFKEARCERLKKYKKSVPEKSQSQNTAGDYGLKTQHDSIKDQNMNVSDIYQVAAPQQSGIMGMFSQLFGQIMGGFGGGGGGGGGGDDCEESQVGLPKIKDVTGEGKDADCQAQQMKKAKWTKSKLRGE